MSTREVIGALPLSISVVTDRVRYERAKDVKRQRTGENSRAPKLVLGVPARSHNLIRALVGTGLTVAVMAAAAAPIPEVLPAVAVGQAAIYRLEVALLIFYGLLLLITPAVSGLSQGRLPIEISTRGAKFAEGTDLSAALAEMRFEELEKAVNGLDEGLLTADLEIKQLKEASRSDNTQPEVNSER
ncbi:MAG TPA: hypothetical protein VFU11_01435 [Solirubrobacterales bacterium]|nr:hypothetical protein [Solirubrobacterales bacterium]